MERLVRQKGRVLLMQWRTFTFKLLVSPAGLFDLAVPDAQADLILLITQESPLAVAQELMQGGKPAVRIEGDVQLAAEVSWLIDHVRWDLEEDLARLLGDAPAHTLVQAARALVHGIQKFAGQHSRSDSGGSPA